MKCLEWIALLPDLRHTTISNYENSEEWKEKVLRILLLLLMKHFPIMNIIRYFDSHLYIYIFNCN